MMKKIMLVYLYLMDKCIKFFLPLLEDISKYIYKHNIGIFAQH
jgi:hypothetical protein